ncbi:FkbM family methyltransferase [Amphritea balenae]|uniref:FkbM family methyltransferase n=1 Tax=Amphritea balenae TaxID=452629 RepID=A0A3P1SI72_9GAMM|nr:FkbM family methyltransferase [Amphritea balenae]RRC96670.1 FkbM family methyltransferase [Amphritea balenae]GGK74800.1 hypothetical protein GCM10007941_26070 [Amphritea balenae]
MISLIKSLKVSQAKRVNPLQRHSYKAFGESIDLEVACDSSVSDREISDIRKLYEPFFASRALPKSGLCLDTGAGEGWFAIPFALCFSKWQVVCFEPEKDVFDRLSENVKRYGLTNIVCINAALHPDLKASPLAVRDKSECSIPSGLIKALEDTQPALFHRLDALGLFAPLMPGHKKGEDMLTLPALPLSILSALSPDFVKMTAPGCEKAIALELKNCQVGYIAGRLYSYVSSNDFYPESEAGMREFYLLNGKHVLRRDYEDSFDNRKAGLDVVVAMYNTYDYIEECVDSLLADGNPHINVIVVDDGSTDGCGEFVAQRYTDNSRVRLVRKANGGCASARNYGRECSNASHIAFIDADDRVDPEMFTALLEVARYTGAFVTEGEFKLLHTKNGRDVFTPSHEILSFTKPGRHVIGDYDFDWIKGEDITTAQPTIWRRVHRRDFLDRQNIRFPEHVRAFDDQIFQLLVAHHCMGIAHVRGHSYHYRQHDAQDIKQGDERHFYSFNMYRNVFQRALDEGWPSVEPVIESLLNTIKWSYGQLRDDLKPIYCEAATEFLATVMKVYGVKINKQRLLSTGISDLDFLVEHTLYDMRNDPTNYGLMRLESWRWQPEFIKMMKVVEN